MNQEKEVLDIQYLRNLADDYVYRTMPSNADSSAYCTIADARKIVTNTKNILDAFIEKLEEIEHIN